MANYLGQQVLGMSAPSSKFFVDVDDFDFT
jgi:hypothetical protein